MSATNLAGKVFEDLKRSLFMISIRMRESYIRQQFQIQKLKDQIRELEAMTSLLSKKERLEFQKEFRKQNRPHDITEGDYTVWFFSALMIF